MGATSSRWNNVPNLITLARICSVPVVVWLMMRGWYQPAFWVFVAAGVSDAIDGFIAKRFEAMTLIGSFLDPIADKALLVSIYVALGFDGLVPMWLVILIVFRDLLIVAGALLFETLTHALAMEPLRISKVNTAVQIVLAATVLGANAFSLSLDLPIEIMVYGVAATTFLSGAAYVVFWTGRAATMERGSGLPGGK